MDDMSEEPTRRSLCTPTNHICDPMFSQLFNVPQQCPDRSKTRTISPPPRPISPPKPLELRYKELLNGTGNGFGSLFAERLAASLKRSHGLSPQMDEPLFKVPMLPSNDNEVANKENAPNVDKPVLSLVSPGETEDIEENGQLQGARVCERPIAENLANVITTYHRFLSNDEEVNQISPRWEWTWGSVTELDQIKDHGIRNPKNKCFLISSLQLLSHVPALCAKIIDHAKNCKTNNCLTCEWRRVMYTNTHRTTELGNIVEIFKGTWPQVDDTQDQDVPECIEHLFTVLSKELGEQDGKSVIDAIFGFKIKNKKVCSRCHSFTSMPDDQDTILKLGLDRNTFEDATPCLQEYLEHTFKAQQLGEVACERCLENTVVKLPFMANLPPVLLISSYMQKVDLPNAHNCEKIHFANNAAALTVSETVYELCGMVHYQKFSNETGHYTASTKAYDSDTTWIDFNDDKFFKFEKNCPGDHTVEGKPYVLMYRKVANNVFVEELARGAFEENFF